jgi:2-dehydropantoate 2-reductase
MKIAVVGAGAMGSVYATLFAEAGHDVWAIDQWAEHVDAINRDGLTLTGFTGDRTVAMSASTSVADAGTCDMYVIATKAAGAGAAAKSIAPFVATDTNVVTIQNGLGAAARITEHIPSDAVVVGVAQGFGAAMVGPGHSHQNGMKMLRLGELAKAHEHSGETARLDKVAAIWADAGFPVQTFGDIDQLIWEKFICNVAVGGPSIVSGLPIGELLASGTWRPIATGCATEAYEVAKALGVNLSFDDPVAYVDAFVAKMPHAKPSMLQDHENGRRSELDAINGQVVEQGRKAGIATPHNDEICRKVREMEQHL